VIASASATSFDPRAEIGPADAGQLAEQPEALPDRHDRIQAEVVWCQADPPPYLS
jgi:hypothetical protein